MAIVFIIGPLTNELSLPERVDGATTVAFAPRVRTFVISVTRCPSVNVNTPFTVIGAFNVTAYSGNELFIVKFVKFGIACVPLIT